MDYKILHLLPSLECRGAQVFARQLINSLSSREGVDQGLVVLSPGIDKIDMAEVTNNITILKNKGIFKKIIALRSLFANFAPDIVFAHGGQPLKFSILASVPKGKFITVYRKIGLTNQWLGSRRIIKLPFQRFLMKKTNAIIAVGEAMKRESIELFHVNPNKIHVIYQGVESTLFAPSSTSRERARKALGIDSDSQVVISVGALGWEKNMGVALRVLSEIRLTLPQVFLVIIGDGPERTRLEHLAEELRIKDAVKFLGIRPDVPNMLPAADLMLLTSLTEGVPGVLIEAGMSSLPCVTWDVAGANEVIQNGYTGIVTPYKDEVSVTEAILYLFKNPERAQLMGAAARAFCLERFDMDKCARAHIQLFEDLLVSHGKEKN